jgi:hypothetical protein
MLMNGYEADVLTRKVEFTRCVLYSVSFPLNFKASNCCFIVRYAPKYSRLRF